jgi:hypothetical protein
MSKIESIGITLATLVIVSGALAQGILNPGITGEIISTTWAMEMETLEKDVGQNVCFKAKIKNTGDLNGTYIIVAKFKQHDTDDWQIVGQKTLNLTSEQSSEILFIGNVECSEIMIGKYYDAKLVLYEEETETILDQKTIPEAWRVKSTMVSGLITGFWLE